jgi:DNA-binding winged helix-turn-helix (wHTH) protein
MATNAAKKEISSEIPVLIGQTGPLDNQRWMLYGSIMIGREQPCEITIPSRQVSRLHARITSTPEGVLLEDLGSKNGTHLNGQLIEEPVILKDGDTIQVALAQQFLFLSSDATLPLDLLPNSGQSNTSFENENHPDSFYPPDDLYQPGGLHQSDSVIRPGGLRLERRSRRVWVGMKEVLPPLSVSQFLLLEILFASDGRVVSRRDLITQIWKDSNAFEVSEQALDALIRRLRDRLAETDPNHAYIITIRGHGLRLENPPS